jgi:hypothetical protein
MRLRTILVMGKVIVKGRSADLARPWHHPTDEKRLSRVMGVRSGGIRPEMDEVTHMEAVHELAFAPNRADICRGSGRTENAGSAP